jgi:hypothetical protein
MKRCRYLPAMRTPIRFKMPANHYLQQVDSREPSGSKAGSRLLRWSVFFAISGLFFALKAPIAGYAQQFEAEGHVTYSMENKTFGRSYQNIKRFIVERNNDQWKIRTVNDDQGSALDSFFAFEESGYNGTNIFCLEQHDKQKLKALVDPKVFQSDRFASALGRVVTASAPRMEPNLIYPIWLAYASLPYFSSLTNGKAVSPLYVQDGLMPEMQFPAKWKVENSLFISDIDWFCEGGYTVPGPYGKPELKKFPAPYDKGFLQAHFQVTTWTNFDDMSLPKDFTMTQYQPAGVVDGVTNFNVGCIITGTIEVVRKLNAFSPVPELTTRTIIRDFRYKFGDQTISYQTTNSWYTEQEIKAILDRKGLIPVKLDTIKNKRMLVISIMAVLTIIPILIITRKVGVKKR